MQCLPLWLQTFCLITVDYADTKSIVGNGRKTLCSNFRILKLLLIFIKQYRINHMKSHNGPGAKPRASYLPKLRDLWEFGPENLPNDSLEPSVALYGPIYYNGQFFFLIRGESWERHRGHLPDENGVFSLILTKFNKSFTLSPVSRRNQSSRIRNYWSKLPFIVISLWSQTLSNYRCDCATTPALPLDIPTSSTRKSSSPRLQTVWKQPTNFSSALIEWKALCWVTNAFIASGVSCRQ